VPRVSPRSIVWILFVVGLGADLLVIMFGHAFLTSPDNPLRHETQEGMVLVALYLGISWLLCPGVAVFRRHLLRRIEVLASFLPLLVAVVAFAIVWNAA